MKNIINIGPMEMYFGQFVGTPNLPKIKPKPKISGKKALENQCRKKYALGHQFLLSFSPIWPPKVEPKSNVFSTCLENVSFTKTKKQGSREK